MLRSNCYMFVGAHASQRPVGSSLLSDDFPTQAPS